ncbi:MAG: response regulator transcription factor [Proteobacteria bacterium]|nr:response regulator transcription factor [Pseudomonadota bacterium]MBU1417169.1 response regulator transcription factor [Pseudomonadota bacterium]MBU1456245.1 response regulator transcription factor [Pseudomonadota bacterium]
MSRILLCSSNENVRAKWFAALRLMHKIHQASLPDEARVILKSYPMDIVLLHRSMIDMDTMSAMCLQKAESCKLFLLSDRPNDEEGLRFLQLGGMGYANTYIAAGRLRVAVQVIESGSVWVGQNLMQKLIERTVRREGEDQQQPADHGIFKDLSRREYQIAALVAEGLGNPAIAEQLDITERTVKAHLGHIYAKTNLKGRLNLALLFNKNS